MHLRWRWGTCHGTLSPPSGVSKLHSRGRWLVSGHLRPPCQALLPSPCQPRGPPSPRTAIAPSPPLAPSPAPAPSSGRLFPGFSSLPGPLRWPREALGRRPALPYDPATPPSAPSVGMMRTSPGTAQSLHPNSPRFCSLPSRSWGPRPLLRESCSCPEPGILYLHKN